MLTGGNGMGLWCHAKPNVSMNDPIPSKNELPPIIKASRLKRSKKTVNSEVDSKVEKSLVQMLEQRVQELQSEADQESILRERTEFALTIEMKEKEKLTENLSQATQRNLEYETQVS